MNELNSNIEQQQNISPDNDNSSKSINKKNEIPENLNQENQQNIENINENDQNQRSNDNKTQVYEENNENAKNEEISQNTEKEIDRNLQENSETKPNEINQNESNLKENQNNDQIPENKKNSTENQNNDFTNENPEKINEKENEDLNSKEENACENDSPENQAIEEENKENSNENEKTNQENNEKEEQQNQIENQENDNENKEETKENEDNTNNNNDNSDINDDNKISKEQNTDDYVQETARSQQAIDNFLKHGIVPAAVQRQKVAQYIKKQQVDSMINGDYHEAAHYYNVCNQFVDACKVARDTSNDDERKQTIKEEIYQLEYKIDDINTEIDAQLENVRKEGEQLIVNAGEKHDENVKNFIEKWEGEDALLAFSKPSFNLQELRRKEKQAILNKDYEAANRFKNEADELEEQETDKAQKLAQQTLEKERTIIEDKYTKQIQSINKTIDHKINKLETKRTQQINPIRCRIKKLENDIEKINTIPPKESHFDIESKNLNQPTILLSPRTRRKLNQFKKTPQYRKLPMQSITCLAKPYKITIPRL